MHTAALSESQEVVEIAPPVFDGCPCVDVQLHPLEVLANLCRKGGHDFCPPHGSRRSATSSPDPAADMYRPKGASSKEPYGKSEVVQDLPNGYAERAGRWARSDPTGRSECPFSSLLYGDGRIWVINSAI